GIDQDDLELYLIDHGLEEMGESTGEKGEPQIVIRCMFADFGNLQKALEDRKLTPLSAEHEYICLTPTELPEPQATEVMELVEAHLVGVACLVLAVLPARGDIADELHAVIVAQGHARQACIAIVRTVAACLAVERAAGR